MRKLIQIRGTNGSGKSTLVRGLLGSFVLHRADDGKQWFSVGADFVSVGDYNKLNPGLDTCGTFENQRKLIKEAWYRWPDSHVVFEGVLAATVWSTWRDFGKELGGKGYLNVFMNTPLQDCYNRITLRRASAGKPPGESAHVRDKYSTIIGINAKCEAEGLPCCWASQPEHVKNKMGTM